MKGLLDIQADIVSNSFSKMRCALIAGVAGMTLSGVSLAGQVGTTTGSFEVTPGGHATYTMGVEVPPGVMGVVPQVAISYNSAGGDGLLGLGGGLSGLSAITRCAKSIVQDTVSQAVQYDDGDYFCLDGQRLILMSGSYGAAGSTYQTELESFKRVTAKGVVAGGPAYFEVLAKGGSKLVFGRSLVNNNHLERALDPVTGAVASWGVSYLEDKHGNRVIYEYQDESRTVGGRAANQVVPKRITYGHNESAAVVGELAVEFVYEARPDKAVGFARGRQYVSDVRLSSIKTLVGTDVVKDYRITYEQSVPSQQSRMSQITECSGQGNCLLPVTLTWNDYSTDWTQGTSLPTAALTAQGRLRGASVDVNNDGHTDWVMAVRESNGNDRLATYLNTHGSWSANSDFVPPAPIFDYQRDADGVSISELVDVNGDGLVDWVLAYQDNNATTNSVFINTGSGWVFDADRSLPTILADLRVAGTPKQRAEFIDLNGDALPDLVSSYRTASGTVAKQTWLNTGSGWQLNASYATPSVLIDYQLYSKGAATGFFLDINNDGLTDFVQAYRNASGTTVRATWLNTGSGWRASSAFRLPLAIADYSAANPQGIASPVDINGDGLVDVVQAHQFSNGSSARKVWLNTGNGWVVDAGLAPPVIAWQQIGGATQTKGTFVDVSNDGRADLVLSYTGSLGSSNTVWRNTGDGWVQDNSLSFPAYLMNVNNGVDSHAKGMIIDANSDGRGDFVRSAGGSSSVIYLHGTNGGRFAHPEVVTRFSDGLGNAYAPEYTPATFDEVYTPGTDGAYPNIDVASPMLLVSAVESSVGVETTSRAEHRYFSKKVNLQGRGDLGFAKKVVLDTRTNVRIESEFSQQWPFIGSPISMHKITAAGVVLMESENRYATQDLFAGKTFAVYQDLKSSTNRELDGQAIDTTTNEVLELDAYGNVLRSKTTRTYHAGGSDSVYSTTKVNTYTNNETSWQLGWVKTSTETISAPGVASITGKSAYTYHTDGSLKTKVLEPGSDKAVTEEYTYDDFGHIKSTKITAPGVLARTTSATYTSDGRFAATATNPVGHTASSEYHPFFGQVTRTEGPNGSVTTKLYDEHGRMIKSTQVRSQADADAAQDTGSRVVVFHPCSETKPCPSNAAYFLGVWDDEGESPETVYYDNRNREVRKQTQGFDGTSVYVDTEYDEFGRKASVTKPYYKGATQVYKTRYYYDLLGRISRVVTPAGKEVRTRYYAGHSTITNPLGQIKTSYINGQGKPSRVVDNKNQVLDYTYDAAGRLLTTVADNNPATRITIEYDEFGRKVKQHDPDLGEWQYRYDALGQLVWQRDAKSQVVTMEYDLLGRITKRTEPEGITQWQYDTGLNGLGKLGKVWNDQGYERRHVYDQYGRAVEMTTVIDGDSTTIKTDYHHTTDRVQYVEYPSGLKIRKEFNDYGFPISIRSSSQNYLDRYEAAEAEAQRLSDEANAYKDSTAATRQGHLDTYNTEKATAEALETENSADERRYHRELPGYNKHIDDQKESIEQAKHFERWGNSFREDAIDQQRKALIYAYAAEFCAAKAEKKFKPWTDFDQLGNPDIWPNGDGLAELQNVLSYILKVPNTQLQYAYNYVKAEDLAHTASWMAGHAENHGKNAQRQMNEAAARYEQVKVHVAAAEVHAGHADAYFKRKLKVILDRIKNRVNLANGHYRNANAAAEEIETIDTALKAKVDAAVNAQRQSQALLNYYRNEASELHWLAESADAEGKITKFTQGKHVSTEINYDQSTGRLDGVFSKSIPAPIELEAGQSIPNTTNRLTEFMAEVRDTQIQASGFEATSLEQLVQVRAQIDSLDANDPRLSPAMQLATQAQIDALLVNESIFNVDYQLNVDISTLTSNTLNDGQALQTEFDNLDNQSQWTNAEQATNNVLVYTARVHGLIASYHSQLKGLYEYASHQQTTKAGDVTNIGAVDNDFLQEYASLGAYHSSIALQHQARADAVVIDDGSAAANPELYGLAKASLRQKRLIDRHADITNKRRRLNVALFAPLQHLNEASREKYAPMSAVQAEHFADNKMLGRSDRERFKQLERLYRDRLAVLETTETQDEDLFANDTERKALYQHLADVNTELGEMYTDMSDQTYWSGMFAGFAQSLRGKSAVYNTLASNHHQIATNNQLLASKSSELYDHSVLGSDDTILNDFYEWDDLGNLTERRHTVANLIETFQYDELNRLTRSAIDGRSVELYKLGGNDIVTYEYDALGNITFKSDVGHYTYANNAGPHAVTGITGDVTLGHKNTTYTYDANGNMLSGDGRSIEYTSFNKPKDVRGDGNPSQFIYGPERQLIKQVEQTGTVPKTTLYFGQYEKIYDGYQTTEKYHLSTHNGGVIAVIIDDGRASSAPKTHYLHRDHLDSIVAITNEQGYVVERFFYDAFGKQLTAVNPDGGRAYAVTPDLELTDRGFTGHKQIQSGLVHMGGRVYDPAIGRFLSADPHIQFAGNLQNYNRYSYVNNNPLSFNDPTGYFISKIFKAIKKLFKLIAKVIKKVIKVIKKVVKFIKENLRVIVAVVVAVAVTYFTAGAATAWAASLIGGTTTSIGAMAIGGAIAGALAGGLSGLIMTGSLSGALKGAALGFVGGAIGGAVTGSGIGQNISKALKLGRTVGQGINAGLSGGIMGKITGGSFSKGFKNAVIGFGAFKGLDAISGGAITDAGKWLDKQGRAFFGTSSDNLAHNTTGKSRKEDLSDKELKAMGKDVDEAKSLLRGAKSKFPNKTVRYATKHEAAKALNKILRPITVKTGVELSAPIWDGGDGFYFRHGDVSVGDWFNVGLPKVSGRAKAAAGYHTHPDYGDDGFSLLDAGWVGKGRPLYMGDENGLFVCSYGSSSCDFRSAQKSYLLYGNYSLPGEGVP